MFTAVRSGFKVGSDHAITLKTNIKNNSAELAEAFFTEVSILPGVGMNTFCLKAWLPGLGEVDLIKTLPLEEAAVFFDHQQKSAGQFPGNKSFKYGGAFLVPFANRIRGEYSPADATISTFINGKMVNLPANWGPVAHAMHGLILISAVKNVELRASVDWAELTGELLSEDFGVGWPSKACLSFYFRLSRQRFEISVKAENVGSEILPVGIGWHPYFLLPSKKREKVRLEIQARARVEIDNYENVFPTGKFCALKNTPYDFSQSGGKCLGKLYLDDCFTELLRDGPGAHSIILSDDEAQYRLEISRLSRNIQAVQVYAPTDENFVAIEPQFNLGDPFSHLWKAGQDTGMVLLNPGEVTEYHLELLI